jgi:MFS family permease
MQTMQTSSELSISEVRILSLASIGGALEFYDFVIFVFFANVIAKLFFAASLPDWVRQAQTFGIFAAGYLARPLGGIVMAHFGDTRGRKRMFTLSVLLMAVPTLLIGVLPTYQSIGLAAPLLLLSMRVLQGVAIGGEAPGAWVFVAEHARRGRVGFAVGLLTSGLSFGILLGSLMTICLNRVFNQAQIAAGAWRIPFLIGGNAETCNTLPRLASGRGSKESWSSGCDLNFQHLDAYREHRSCNFDDSFADTKVIWDPARPNASG